MSKVPSAPKRKTRRHHPYHVSQSGPSTSETHAAVGEGDEEGEVVQVPVLSANNISPTNPLWIAALRTVAIKYSSELTQPFPLTQASCDKCPKVLQDGNFLIVPTLGIVRCLSCWFYGSWVDATKVLRKDLIDRIEMAKVLSPAELSYFVDNLGINANRHLVLYDWARELEKQVENRAAHKPRTRDQHQRCKEITKPFFEEVEKQKKLAAEIYKETHKALISSPSPHAPSPTASSSRTSPAPVDAPTPAGKQPESRSSLYSALASPHTHAPPSEGAPCAGCRVVRSGSPGSACSVCEGVFCNENRDCRLPTIQDAKTLWKQRDKRFVLMWIKSKVGAVRPQFESWLMQKDVDLNDCLREILADQVIRSRHCQVLPSSLPSSADLRICSDCSGDITIAEIYGWWCHSVQPQYHSAPTPSGDSADEGSSSEGSFYAKDDTWAAEADDVFRNYGHLFVAKRGQSTSSAQSSSDVDAGSNASISGDYDVATSDEGEDEGEVGYAESEALTDSGNEADVEDA